jgi:GT2 family glycosyltransferase
MDLSIIILNWNAAEDTIACVGHILCWQQLQPTVVIVDNHSQDGSADFITARYPEVPLIQNGRNLGFAGGTNRGIDAALSLSNAPVLLLNNDAYMAEKDVIQLLQTLQANPRVGLLVPLLFDAETDDLISAGGKNPVKHHQTRMQEFKAEGALQIVEVVSGTAVLIRADVFRQAGLLDERFFFSTELADLCLRARRYQFLSAVDQRARARHTLSRSSRFRDSLYMYYIVRNRFLILRNHYRWHFLLYGFWAGYSLALWLKLFIGNHSAPAQAVFLGLSDGLRGRFGGQNERVLAILQA